MPTLTFTRHSQAPDQQTHDALLQILHTIQDVSVVATGNPIKAVRRRNVLKNRWAMTATIKVADGVITATIEGQGSMQAAFAEEILGELPRNMVDDRGLSAALERMSRSERFFSAAELNRLQDELRPLEEVRLMAACAVDRDLALIVVTSQRVLLKDKRFFSSATREIYPAQITSITTGRSMGNETLDLTVSNAQIRIRNLQMGRAEALAREIRSMASPAHSANTTLPQPVSAAEELGKLAHLHSSGVLSDAEFAIAKARLLGM
jgi:Bacterial PH domain